MAMDRLSGAIMMTVHRLNRRGPFDPGLFISRSFRTADSSHHIRFCQLSSIDMHIQSLKTLTYSNKSFEQKIPACLVLSNRRLTQRNPHGPTDA
jgi:hypothetical protein